jgi:NAD(P)-dependent dehydrogenase (short-subunit alcohol dehydrogenase family)
LKSRFEQVAPFVARGSGIGQPTARRFGREGWTEADLAVNIVGALHTIRAAVAQFGACGGMILLTSGGLATEPNAEWASLGLGKAALRNLTQALVAPLAERGIRIAMATIATLLLPASPEAEASAELLWRLATDRSSGWEATYP